MNPEKGWRSQVGRLSMDIKAEDITDMCFQLSTSTNSPWLRFEGFTDFARLPVTVHAHPDFIGSLQTILRDFEYRLRDTSRIKEIIDRGDFKKDYGVLAHHGEEEQSSFDITLPISSKMWEVMVESFYRGIKPQLHISYTGNGIDPYEAPASIEGFEPEKRPVKYYLLSGFHIMYHNN
jgi:hypothetical protein